MLHFCDIKPGFTSGRLCVTTMILHTRKYVLPKFLLFHSVINNGYRDNLVSVLDDYAKPRRLCLDVGRQVLETSVNGTNDVNKVTSPVTHIFTHLTGCM
jgi:hypothetical protein